MSIKRRAWILLWFLFALGANLPGPNLRAQTFLVPPGKIAGNVLLHQQIKARKATLSAKESDRYARSGLKLQSPEAEDCALYVAAPLSADEIAKLKSQGIQVSATYVPPVAGRHAHGFYLASVAYSSLPTIQSDARFLRLDSVEFDAMPMNDQAAVQTHALEVQNGIGVTARNGAGIKVAVADSGFDLTHADLPTPVEKYDLTDGNSVATWGSDVSNHASPHGTHVLGTIGGSGLLSSGKYKGAAPGASYYLYKIGNDSTAGASNSDIIEAITRAQSVGCKIFSMSYGGPDDSLDGSDATCQAIDAATAAGMTCFISAGNEGDGGNTISHTLVNVAPSSSVNSIGYAVSNSSGVTTYSSPESITLLWRDNLSADFNVTLSCTNLAGGESLTGGFASISTRGTETRTYTLNPNIAAGNSKTYLFTLTNGAASGVTAPVHLLSMSGTGNFTAFVDAGTVMSPAVADTAMAIGAWTQRKTWTNYQGSGFQFSNLTVNTIAPFSSRGPRIDGVVKPEVAAPGAATISARDSGPGLATTAALIVDNDGLNLNGSGPANYYVMTGTSMACPYAAGIAALVLEQNPTLTPAQLRSVLQQTAAHPGATDGDSGYGLLNALAAVQLAGSPTTAPEADLFNGASELPSGGGPVDFGTVVRGATSPTLTLTLNNTGNAALATSGTLSLPAHFSLIEGLSTSIPAGGNDTFTIQFDSSTSGTFSGTASFANSDADENPYTFTVSGTVTQPEISVSPSALPFGARAVDAGPSSAQSVTITNQGTAALHLSSVALGGSSAFAIFSDSGQATLAPAASRTVQIRFDPSAHGLASGNLTIQSDDTDEATVVVPLTGTGLTPSIAFNTSELLFAPVDVVLGGSPTTQSLVLENQGDGPLQITALTLGGSEANDFSLVGSPTLPLTLNAGTTQGLQLRFAPQESTRSLGLSATLTIVSNDSGSPAIIDLRGDAVPVEVSQFSVD